MPKADITADLRDRIALTREEAAGTTSLSPRMIDSLIADQSSKFPFAKIGSRIVIPRHLLEIWIAEQVEKKD